MEYKRSTTIKIRDESGRWIPYRGLDPEKFEELAALVGRCLEQRGYVIICITGNKGIGKSTLGKFIRKRGFGPYKPRHIAVIDDDCMSVEVLHFFRRRYVNPCAGVDELKPFFGYCTKRPIRIYIKSNPESHISRADILLLLDTDEEERRRRLLRRYGREKGESVFQDTRSYEEQPPIAFQYRMRASVP